MKPSEKTIKFNIGNVTIGGDSKILLQSMCNFKTSEIDKVVQQINLCTSLGADLMRISVKDDEDLLAIKEIKKTTSIPLIADIHFVDEYVIKAIENGIDAIRINPLNINLDSFLRIVDCAKKHDTAIRIGFNSGSRISFDSKEFISLVKQYVSICENANFNKLVLSYKDSNILNTIKYTKLLSESFNYPVHIGLTEAGTIKNSLLKSGIALGDLLLSGIGNTIRISITGNPEDEIIAARKVLGFLNIVKCPEVISCPTCGRTEVDIKDLADKIENYLFKNNINITVAVMGCAVNGPGEASKADIGLAGGKKEFILFKQGTIIKKVPQNIAFEALIEEINNL